MDKATFNQILELNKEFYKCVADEFSTTRQYPWQGWSKVIETYEKLNINSTKVLDLGCGNGRFYDFIKNIEMPYDYTGLDENPKLLELARKKHRKQCFKEWDVITNLSCVESKYNLVTAFGVTHHIPSREYRKVWFQDIINLCEDKCMVAFTFWNFHYLKEKIITEVDKAELDDNDYFLGWGDKINIMRYAHRYDGNELMEITQIFKKSGFQEPVKYNSDGRNKLLNHYMLYHRP